MLVKNIMTMSPVAVTGDDPVAVAAQYMADWDVGILPVVNNQIHKRLVGVITDRDIALRCMSQGDPAFCQVRDHMTPSPLATAYPETEIHTAMETMKRARVRRLPVVDVDETVLGMLTLADIARHLGPTDSAAVGRLVAEISQPVPIPV